MNRFAAAAAILVATAAPSAAAVVTVVDIGPVLNDSLPLPAESPPGSSGVFAQYFTFSLPMREEVTASVSDSGIGAEKVVGGVLSVSFHTSTGSGPLFIPAGALIENSPLTDTAGGQEATVGPGILNAGAYFVEVSGTSGAAPLKLAIDGTVTASTVPEASTWAMMLLGAGFLAWSAARRRLSIHMVDSLT